MASDSILGKFDNVIVGGAPVFYYTPLISFSVFLLFLGSSI